MQLVTRTIRAARLLLRRRTRPRVAVRLLTPSRPVQYARPWLEILSDGRSLRWHYPSDTPRTAQKNARPLSWLRRAK